MAQGLLIILAYAIGGSNAASGYVKAPSDGAVP